MRKSGKRAFDDDRGPAMDAIQDHCLVVSRKTANNSQETKKEVAFEVLTIRPGVSAIAVTGLALSIEFRSRRHTLEQPAV